MTITLFLTLIAAALVFGWWLGTCWARAGHEIDAVLGDARRGWDVNDAADTATDSEEWEVAL